MTTHRLYYVTLSLVSPAVADSPEIAERIAREWHELANGDAVFSASVALATEPPATAEELADIPRWEYPLFADPADGQFPEEIEESKHPRRAWTIRRWLAEQAPIEAPAPPDPAIPAPDDWRPQPTRAEAAAHHESNADESNASLWIMRPVGRRIAVLVSAPRGVIPWLAHEDTRWRPVDALLTPVAWPVMP